MDSFQRVPRARQDDLVITESGDELLIYDSRSHHIHHLNPLASAVWRACNEQHAVHDLVIETGATADAVMSALGLLGDADLLAGSVNIEPSPRSVSRRRLVRKAALSGAMVPVIISVSAPQASAANSLCPGALLTAALCTAVGTPCLLPDGECGACYYLQTCTGYHPIGHECMAWTDMWGCMADGGGIPIG